jgi:DNA repair protein RecO (recombination protein O)
MPLAAAQAFVLGASPLSEQDRTVYLLTLERGIMRAIAPGALKVKNRFGALFELFTEGDFHYYWKENREIATISKGEIINSYFTIVSDPKNIFYFYLAADVLLHFIPYDHADKRLYRLVHSILSHCREGVEINLLTLYFLIWVLRIEGMMFKTQICYNCYSQDIKYAWFKKDFQGILCPRCHTGETIRLDPGELQMIRWTEKNSPAQLSIWKDKIDTAKLIRAFTRKIEYHGECTLKAAQYLSEFY